MTDDKKGPEKKPRTPGRKLTKEDLGRVSGGRQAALARGCCTQSCCGDSTRVRSMS